MKENLANALQIAIAISRLQNRGPFVRRSAVAARTANIMLHKESLMLELQQMTIEERAEFAKRCDNIVEQDSAHQGTLKPIAKPAKRYR